MISWRGVDAGATDDDLSPFHPERPESSGWRFALELPVLLLAAAVIALVVKAVLAQAFYIPSASMEPQLAAGDRVVVSRLSYRMHDPRRGDIVVFHDPAADDGDDGFSPLRLGREALEALGVVKPRDKELIKRVVGLPGETVSARGGTVLVDGQPLFEPYLDETAITGDFGPAPVPEGHLFVMGDNRGNSKDSRRFGPVDRDLVVGRAIATVWPPGRAAFL